MLSLLLIFCYVLPLRPYAVKMPHLIEFKKTESSGIPLRMGPKIAF
jgi:hypothetical protein